MMNRNDTVRIPALVFLSFVAWHASDATAEIVDFGDNKVPTQTMELADDSDLGGRSARFDGVIPGKGQRLVVNGLDVMSPLVVRVFAKDIRKPADVSLHRYFWGKRDAEGSTGASGDWEFRGRVNDELGIALSAPESTPVYALVWQGPAVPGAAVPTLVVDMDRETTETGGIDMMTVGIAGLLFVIAILLAMQLIKRRSTATIVIIAASMLALAQDEALAQSGNDAPPNPFVDEADTPAADEPPNPFDDDQKSQGADYKPEDPGPKPEGESSADDSKLKPDPDSNMPPSDGSQTATDGSGDTKPKPDPNADQPDSRATKLKPDPDADKPDSRATKLKPDPDADKPDTRASKLKPDPDADKPDSRATKLKPDADKPESEPGDARQAESDTESGSMDSDDPTSPGDSATGGDRSFGERLENAYAEIRQLQSEVASNSARIGTLEFLINQDRDAVPEPGDGAPPISVSCDNDPDCQACLQDTNQELSVLLVNLDKLRIIYTSYMRYRDYMVGLGDSLSGFHQLEQAAWYRVKLQIEEATVGLQSAYDTKLDDYKVRLSDSLAALSTCDSVDGDPVFTRESVLFENYVKAKYSRER